MGLGLGLHLAALFDEVDGRHGLQLVAEVVADRRLQHLVDQVGHGADGGDHLGRLGVRHMDLDLKVEGEDEALARLGDDLAQVLVVVVGRRAGLGPIESEDEGRHDLGRVAARIDGVFAGAQRLLPDAAVARTDQVTELEIGPGGVLGGQADIGLDHRHLALLDHQHRIELHRHQERIEVVGAVEQRVVLQADAAAVVEEGLEVLIVVVHGVLGRQQGFDQGGVLGLRISFELGHVGEIEQAVGDGALGQRKAVQGGDDADHVDDLAVFVGARLDPHNFQLGGLQAEGLAGEAALVAQPGIGLVNRLAEYAVAADHQEADRMDRGHGARRQDGALDALLAAALGEGGQVIEVAELRLVGRRLGADGQVPAHLGDDHADLARRDLHHRVT